MIGIGIGINKRRGGGVTWSESMLASYLSINSHVTYSEAQQTLISSRLNETYVVDTFGPGGLNKSVCDFFILFNMTIITSERLLIKTGEIIRWNYGGGNIYVSNSLTVNAITDGITGTSVDGFEGLTYIDMRLAAWEGFWPLIACTNARFRGSLNGAQSISGKFPTVKGIYSLELDGGWDFTGCAGNDFQNNATVVNFSGNSFSTAEVDSFLLRANVYFTASAPTASCVYTLSGTGMGIPTGGASNTDLISLISKYTDKSLTCSVLVNT